MPQDDPAALPPPAHRSIWNLKPRWRGMAEAGIACALCAPWIGLLGHWHWFPDLASHFQWQYLITTLGAMAVAGVMRSRRLLMAALLTGTLVGAGILSAIPKNHFTPAPGPSQPSLRVVCFNVLTSNPSKPEVLEYLQSCNADIIFLLETDTLWIKAMRPLLATHPTHLAKASSDNFGIAYYSRLPVIQHRLLESAQLGKASPTAFATPSLEVTLSLRGQLLTIAGTHPVPPMGAEFAHARDWQLLALTQYLRNQNHPVLLMGDFNATPWCRIFRKMREEFPGWRPAPGSHQPTWKSNSLVALPIDHCFAAGAIDFVSRGIGPSLGSDHRPQVLDFAFPLPSAHHSP